MQTTQMFSGPTSETRTDLRQFTLSAVVASAVLAVGLMAFSPSATAQSVDLLEGAPISTPEEASVPDGHPDPNNVDDMLSALSAAPTPAIAKGIERRVLQLWSRSGSPTIDLLMERSAEAMETNDYGVALELLDTVVELDPDYAEGWNRRATVYYVIDEYNLSIADVVEVLRIEPRHFGALSGLGLMLREMGNDTAALKAFREALAVHPHLDNIGDAAQDLASKVDGMDI